MCFFIRTKRRAGLSKTNADILTLKFLHFRAYLSRKFLKIFDEGIKTSEPAQKIKQCTV